MPNPSGDQELGLDAVMSHALFLLFKHRQRFASARDIHSGLQKEFPALKQGIRLKQVERMLKRLEVAGYLESTKLPRPVGHSGPDPTGYGFAVDSPTITWPSTARIVVELWNRGRSVPYEPFVSEVLNLSLHDDGGRTLTREDLENQIAWCTRPEKNYMQLREDYDPNQHQPERRVSATPKVARVLNFLELIAERSSLTENRTTHTSSERTGS
jgi:hypothetical protein